MGTNVNDIADYITNDMNVILAGPAGTGKTTMVMEACKTAGLKMKYFSASTMDPYIDLVGIPTVEGDGDSKRLVMVSPAELDDVDVLFIDEINRAELKTQNGFFEIAQFRTINGRELKNIKAVVAAFNPPADGYIGVNDLDAALLDRFDVFLETSDRADSVYFAKTFGDRVGNALVTWHRAHDQQKGYISPRRLEKIGHAWAKLPRLSTLADLMPAQSKANVDGLYSLLNNAVAAAASGGKLADKIGLTEDQLMDAPMVRSSRDKIEALLTAGDLDEGEIISLSSAVATALSSGVSPEVIVGNWGTIITHLDPKTQTTMTDSWKRQKYSIYITESRQKGLIYGSAFKGKK